MCAQISSDGVFKFGQMFLLSADWFSRAKLCFTAWAFVTFGIDCVDAERNSLRLPDIEHCAPDSFLSTSRHIANWHYLNLKIIFQPNKYGNVSTCPFTMWERTEKEQKNIKKLLRALNLFIAYNNSQLEIVCGKCVRILRQMVKLNNQLDCIWMQTRNLRQMSQTMGNRATMQQATRFNIRWHPCMCSLAY